LKDVFRLFSDISIVTYNIQLTLMGKLAKHL